MTYPNGSIEAEYSDGYIHNEAQLNDISPFEPDRNILNDILEKRPEAEHGQMVRFSVFHNKARIDIDWVELPPSARPIRYKHMERDHNLEGVWVDEARLVKVGFGYQYNDSSGKNHEIIQEL